MRGDEAVVRAEGIGIAQWLDLLWKARHDVDVLFLICVRLITQAIAITIGAGAYVGLIFLGYLVHPAIAGALMLVGAVGLIIFPILSCLFWVNKRWENINERGIVVSSNRQLLKDMEQH